MKDFNLLEFVPQIVAIAEKNEVGAADAVDYFIVNLNSLSDFYKGADDLNFRELGQFWNRLNYKVRNKQRIDAVSSVAKKILPPRSRRED